MYNIFDDRELIEIPNWFVENVRARVTENSQARFVHILKKKHKQNTKDYNLRNRTFLLNQWKTNRVPLILTCLSTKNNEKEKRKGTGISHNSKWTTEVNPVKKGETNSN